VARIAVPKFRARILRIRSDTGLLPSTTGLARSRCSPEDVNGPFDGDGLEMIDMDLFERLVVTDSGGGVNVVQGTGLGGLPNGIPVSFVITLLETLSQLELGVGNPSVLLPDIFLCGVTSGELSMVVSEGGPDSGEANSLIFRT